MEESLDRLTQDPRGIGVLTKPSGVPRHANLEALGRYYSILSPAQRLARVYEDFERVLVTSSFGASAVLLLHYLAQVRPGATVHFIDTGYHFSETLAYRDRIAKLLSLNVVNLVPEPAAHEATQTAELWKTDPDACCRINKVEPLNQIKAHYDVWISGLQADQTEHRKNLELFERRGPIIKFYPLLDLTLAEAQRQLIQTNLPLHPLLFLGYESIGCRHCTRPGTGRAGRWSHLGDKVECGLHTE